MVESLIIVLEDIVKKVVYEYVIWIYNFNMENIRKNNYVKYAMQSMESALVAYHNPLLKGNVEGFYIHAFGAWEAILKAMVIEKKGCRWAKKNFYIRDREGNVKKSKVGEPWTISLMDILREGWIDINPNIKENLAHIQVIRDKAIHHIGLVGDKDKAIRFGIISACYLNFKLFLTTFKVKRTLYIALPLPINNIIRVTLEKESVGSVLESLVENMTPDNEGYRTCIPIKFEVERGRGGYVGSAIECDVRNKYPWGSNEVYEILRKEMVLDKGKYQEYIKDNLIKLQRDYAWIIPTCNSRTDMELENAIKGYNNEKSEKNKMVKKEKLDPLLKNRGVLYSRRFLDLMREEFGTKGGKKANL